MALATGSSNCLFARRQEPSPLVSTSLDRAQTANASVVPRLSVPRPFPKALFVKVGGCVACLVEGVAFRPSRRVKFPPSNTDTRCFRGTNRGIVQPYLARARQTVTETAHSAFRCRQMRISREHEIPPWTKAAQPPVVTGCTHAVAAWRMLIVSSVLTYLTLSGFFATLHRRVDTLLPSCWCHRISTPSFSTSAFVTSSCILFVSAFVSVRSRLR